LREVAHGCQPISGSTDAVTHVAYRPAVGSQCRIVELVLNLIAVAEKFNVDRRYLRKALPTAGFTIRRAGKQQCQS
jgi:hypothetical protein